MQSDNSLVIHIHVVQPNLAVKTINYNMLLVLLFMIVFSLEDSP